MTRCTAPRQPPGARLTGHIRWKAHLGGDISEGPSVGPDGTIYESTDAGVLHAINPANGHDLWHFSGGGPIGGDLSTTAAILPDGSIVWPGPRHTVYGLDTGGRKLWTVMRFTQCSGGNSPYCQGWSGPWGRET